MQEKLFIDLDKLLFDIYEERELKCLSEIKLGDKKITSVYHNIIENKKRANDFNSVDFIFDIEFISQDIKFFTGLLFILRPFINIPSQEKNTYFQNKYDHRYLVFASVAHQNVYNFWDRIGDILYCFFETGLNEKKVYFSSVLNNFPKEYLDNEYFKELKLLYDDKIKIILDSRHQIVHYKQLETKHYLGIFQNYKSEELKYELEKEKLGYPEYFLEHLNLSNYAFEITIKLIDSLPNIEKDD